MIVLFFWGLLFAYRLSFHVISISVVSDICSCFFLLLVPHLVNHAANRIVLDFVAHFVFCFVAMPICCLLCICVRIVD